MDSFLRISRAPAWSLFSGLFAVVFGCKHARTTRPLNNHETCLDCGSARLYRFTDTGIFVGKWRRPLPDPTPKRWSYRTEAMARINPADMAILRRRNLGQPDPASIRQIIDKTNKIVDRHMPNLAVRG